jgi:hypothetical protein
VAALYRRPSARRAFSREGSLVDSGNHNSAESHQALAVSRTLAETPVSHPRAPFSLCWIPSLIQVLDEVKVFTERESCM